MKFKFDWKKFYPARFRLVCVKDECGTAWVFQKRFLLVFWREYSRVLRYETAMKLLDVYRSTYEERGYL